MVVDYSKWDKIELSDDSDVEVHPNVDKRSFIKWKQQSIHEEREKRNADIKNLEVQLTMYTHLNKRVDKLLSSDGLPVAKFADLGEVTKYLNANFDKTEKCTGDNVDPNIGTYNEMVEDLFEQLKRDAVSDKEDPNDGEVIKQHLLKHREKIESVSKEAHVKLDQLYKEKNAHISSDDIHTGFDSGFINIKKEEEESRVVNKALEKLEVVNEDTTTAELTTIAENTPMSFIDFGDDVTRLAAETEKFGLIPFKDYRESQRYLLGHMQILSEQQKDALMMKAFEFEMEKDGSPMTYQVIHQSELLGYVREVYDLKKIPFLNLKQMEEVINVFFSKVIFNPNNVRGRESFLESVRAKYEHVKQRVKVLQKESSQEGEGVETIQLKSLDDSTELEVTLPDFTSKDPVEVGRCEAFNKLPKDMQEAVKTKDLDTVNKVFESIPIKEAEDILELFDEAGVIGVKALLENEEDFNQIKQQYQGDVKEPEGLEAEETGDVVTTDVVD